MSALGAIGYSVTEPPSVAGFSFGSRALSTISGSDATPGSEILVSFRRSQVATARANDLGVWTIGGLNDGTYWAAELGVVRGWLIVVSGASVTVTKEVPPDAGDIVTSGFSFGGVG